MFGNLIQYLPFVQDYVDIAKQLGLLDSYAGSHRRVKYKVLSHKGSGFLFSVQPPSVVLPSDRVGVLMELNKALAELRAGNFTPRSSFTRGRDLDICLRHCHLTRGIHLKDEAALLHTCCI